jgi:hypothetical protein
MVRATFAGTPPGVLWELPWSVNERRKAEMDNIEERAWRIMDALLMMKWLSVDEIQAVLGRDFTASGEVILWLAARSMIDCRMEGDQLIVTLSKEEQMMHEAPAWPLRLFDMGMAQS